MQRQKRFVVIMILLLMVLAISYGGYHRYRFVQSHPLANQVYRYRTSTATKNQLTSTPDDYHFVVFGAGKYLGQYIKVDNQKQLKRILNHRQAYQAAFNQNGARYLVRNQQRLQMDLEDMQNGESYVRDTKRVWTEQPMHPAVEDTASGTLKLTSLHATKQAISSLP